MNTFGTLFRVTTFGESHGPALGGVVDGMPAGVAVDTARLAAEMARRAPGRSPLATPRREPDEVEILSGTLDGVTTGAPIGLLIRNCDQRPADYAHLAGVCRPGHADLPYMSKYGIRDHRGGGRGSARETAVRVAAGALARMALDHAGISVHAYTSRIGSHSLPAGFDPAGASLPPQAGENAVRCPHPATAALMEEAIREARRRGDTLGGRVTCVATGLPPGLGEPLYGKLSARLAAAMMSIPAAKAFELGDGTALAAMTGSEALDRPAWDADGRPCGTLTNHGGGLQGGLSNGMPVVMHVTFRPTPTLMQPLTAIGPDGAPVELPPRGRHDPCVVPRAVAVVEAMACCTILDALLLNKAHKITDIAL